MQSFVRSVLGIAVLALLSYFVYDTMYHQQQQQILIDKLRDELFSFQAHSPSGVINGGTPSPAKRWTELQPLTKDTVVQVFSQVAQFNWLEPYKTPNQFQAVGSGFFIHEDGKILTNAHVVDQTKAVSIQIPSMGKRRFEVDVIGVSPERDLALLQLHPRDLAILTKELGKIPTLNLGNSDYVHRADEIMALGYPLGQQALKSTTGVVSGREHIEGHSLIQISAPINPGSSGGPSLNTSGEVIGINSSGIFGGGVQNVGYIIPSNEVALFLRHLEQTQPGPNNIKFLRKPFLGVLFNNATEDLTTFLGNPQPGGLYVVETYRNSPLDKAGVLPGDMIYEIDGYKIDLFGEMNVPWSEDKISIVDYVSRLKVGDNVQLVVYRNGKRKSLKLTFNQVELAPIRAMYPGYEKIDYEVIGGMVISQLALNHLPALIQGAPELARFTEFKNQMKPALVVTHVFPDSASSRTRTIGAGAIISEINGEPVTTLEELRKAIKKSLATNYLTVKTNENVFIALPFDPLLEDEKRLARNYFYQITPLVQELLASKSK